MGRVEKTLTAVLACLKRSLYELAFDGKQKEGSRYGAGFR
jgi:hypothetical protein